MRLRRMEPGDVGAVVAIQAACPEVAQWATAEYERAAWGESAWVAEDEKGIAGFLVARRLAGETEILNLAVREDVRRRGVATSLLREATSWSKSIGVEAIILEVRAGNVGALTLYEKSGFRAVGRRPQYYVQPSDDALLLSFPI